MTTGKTIALTRRTFVGKVLPLLFNMLSRLVQLFYRHPSLGSKGHRDRRENTFPERMRSMACEHASGKLKRQTFGCAVAPRTCNIQKTKAKLISCKGASPQWDDPRGSRVRWSPGLKGEVVPGLAVLSVPQQVVGRRLLMPWGCSSSKSFWSGCSFSWLPFWDWSPLGGICYHLLFLLWNSLRDADMRHMLSVNEKLQLKPSFL